ncbi:HlyD family efflux transporter periplasmic adaptor subunit [Synechococcus sp. CBW1108]|uniref:HlyD family efflux transporter periplasmic adaptor subunit n=1 Tax=Synechococcus sp. CBW1108 TaxID=1353147 RepID=UPI0018CD932E|nr:HlyD family efflux transporter periplasmic adaptor subunit [Synechococcus sp. CBW1108]QPN69369.1 HlyD family efflux transporter periplasmic adaptor subunit [Synechococcus sp. CBW1108]
MTNLGKRSKAALVARPLDYQEVRLKAAPVWSQAVVWTIIGTASLGFIYAVTAKIDEVVVANGTIQALGAARPIMSPAPGVVSQIFVKEGQSVRAGEPLLRFDPEVSQTRRNTLQQQLRLERQRFQEQERAFRAREQSLGSRTESLEGSVETERVILSQIEPLAREGGIQTVQVLQQKNKIQQLRSEIAQSEANLREVQAELVKLRQESLRNLSDLERQLVEVNKAREYEMLRAPLAGMVFELKPSSPGYAASANETLLKVVPSGTLEAKVFLTNRDVGFARPGQEAQVRVDAFPFTQFGSIPGRLKAIGTDSLPPDPENPLPRFPAYVALDRLYLENNGTRHQVSSGQTVSVNLVVREKRVITLLTDAVQKAIDSLRRIRS